MLFWPQYAVGARVKGRFGGGGGGGGGQRTQFSVDYLVLDEAVWWRSSTGVKGFVKGRRVV